LVDPDVAALFGKRFELLEREPVFFISSYGSGFVKLGEERSD